MSAAIQRALFGIVMCLVTVSLASGQVIIDTGIDTTIAAGGLLGPDEPHDIHPEDDGTLWEFDGQDGMDDLGNTGRNQGLLWFDIPAATLAKFTANDFAQLTLYGFDGGNAADMYRITEDWLSGPDGGNEVTWFSMPARPTAAWNRA